MLNPLRGIKLTLQKAVVAVKASINAVKELAAVKWIMKWYGIYKAIRLVVRIIYAFYSGDWSYVFGSVSRVIRVIIDWIK